MSYTINRIAVEKNRENEDEMFVDITFFNVRGVAVPFGKWLSSSEYQQYLANNSYLEDSIIPLWEATALSNFSDSRTIAVREFLDRFSENEWDSINVEARTNVILARLKDKVFAGTAARPGYIDLESQEVDLGLMYLVSIGIITLDRKNELLS